MTIEAQQIYDSLLSNTLLETYIKITGDVTISGIGNPWASYFTEALQQHVNNIWNSQDHDWKKYIRHMNAIDEILKGTFYPSEHKKFAKYMFVVSEEMIRNNDGVIIKNILHSAIDSIDNNIRNIIDHKYVSMTYRISDEFGKMCLPQVMLGGYPIDGRTMPHGGLQYIVIVNTLFNQIQ